MAKENVTDYHKKVTCFVYHKYFSDLFPNKQYVIQKFNVVNET